MALLLFELLLLMPRFTTEQTRRNLETTFLTATAAVKLLEEQGIVTELTEKKEPLLQLCRVRRSADA